MNLRPVSNLVVPEALKLPVDQVKAKFMYLYSGFYKGKSPQFMTRLWASVLFPATVNNPKFGTAHASVRKGVRALLKASHLGMFLSVKKVMDAHDPHFMLDVPVFAFNPHQPNGIQTWFVNFMLGQLDAKKDAEGKPPQIPEEVLNEFQAFSGGGTSDDEDDGFGEPSSGLSKTRWTGIELLQALKGVDANGIAQLRQTLLGMEIKTKGGLGVVYLKFKVSKEEAQQLSTTPWVQMRNMDLYPLIRAWVDSFFGYTEKGASPTASFPVTRIAREIRSMPVDRGDARVNEHGLSIGPNGRAYFLPMELDRTVQYEDRYNQAGSRAGDNFSLFDMDDVDEGASINLNQEEEEAEGADDLSTKFEPKVALPHHMPVLIDWVNNKYSYTNGSGALQVLDLVRYRTADISHIVNILKSKNLDQTQVMSFRGIGEAARVPVSSFQPMESDISDPDLGEIDPAFLESFRDVQGPDAWFKQALIAYKMVYPGRSGIPLAEIRTNGISYLRPLARYFKAIKEAVGMNLDAIYNRYSVQGTSASYATLTLIAVYCDDLPMHETQDRANRKAALDQKIDPNWKLPSVPLMDDKAERPVSRLPHQEKVRNLLKDSPDFAILPVQAGGGKTILLLLDVLLEIKANRSEPYLMLCPGHLVPNYVKEVQAFTGGKLNVIPITTYSLRRQGWKRLQKMLETAPRNTVVVADYDVLKYRPKTSTASVCYGTTSVDVYPVIEFLRQFRFGYVALDESHKVKNDSARTKAAMSLITDIPKKRLASGTMVHDNASDLAMQIAMMDPTLFGTREEFMAKYGEEFSGNKVTKWKETYAQEVMDKIKERVVVAGAMRKEWAAFLPKQRHHFKPLSLTPEQYRVYNLILQATLEEIQAAAVNNPLLQAFLNNKTQEGMTDEEKKEANADEEDGESLANLLKPYLSRLESFTNAPGLDELGKIELHGEDLLSPKVAYALHRIRLHIEGGIDDKKVQHQPETGKVLVFCNTHNSVDAFWDAAPDDLKACGLKYSAANKEDDADNFENNANIKWMIGIEQSMNEGLNFQFATRLIRMSGVWNPGTLEQGNSRINRPELKKSVRREYIYYDWLMADGTIDITKIGRLISKMVAVGKFENSENPAYGDIENLDVLKMDLESVIGMNNWTILEPYNEAYKQYIFAQQEEYADYQKNYIEKFGHPPELIPVDHAESPKDAQLMATVPYIAGQRLYNEKGLGLVRLDEYLRAEDEGDDDEDAAAPVVENKTERQRIREAALKIKGRRVHTEFGEGYFVMTSADGRRCDVVLDSGNKINLRLSSVFLLTNPKVTKNIRHKILTGMTEYTGLEPTEEITEASSMFKPAALPKNAVIPDTPKGKPVVTKPVTKVEKPEESQTIVELQFNITNGFLGIRYDIEEANQAAANILEALGFRHTPQYVYAHIPNAKVLIKLFNAWREDGFVMDTEGKEAQATTRVMMNAISKLHELMEGGSNLKNLATFNFSTKNDLRNFFRLEFKPNNNPKVVKPYPMMAEGKAYIAMPVQGQSGTKAAIKVRVPGIKWMMAQPSLTYFGMDRTATAKMMQKIQEAGIQISNIKDMRREFVVLKKARIRLREDQNEPNKMGQHASVTRDHDF